MRQTLVGLTLAILLTACAAQDATTNITPDAWRADLRYLAAELPRRHVNAFHTNTRERFADEVARLDAAIPRLTNDESVVGLMRTVALIGDGHTHLDLPPSFPRYPIELHWFGDELRVVAAGAPYHAALGARVVAIGDVPLAELMKRTTELVPRDETAGRTRETAAMQLTSPEVLHGLGVIADRERAPFVLDNAAGERITVTLSPVRIGDFSSWRVAGGDKPPLYLRRLNEPWWTEFLPDTQTVYFSFSAYPQEAEFRERAAALAKLLDESHTHRLVIDLRRNQGGDFQRFRSLLLPIIEARSAINRAGGLFVIIGPGTFSAAGVSALDLRNRAHAILVGTPAGIRPNHYGDSAEFRLPNSGLRISYATQFHRFGTDTDSEIVPDKRIEPTWEEFRAGRDPIMEWILSYAR
ncbi:MAG: hypothetical protein DMF76_08245 [Acidobacteria bacterium]|nr:MAG: hypothetical protein DMF76_08245 [Acidobacteriota bacterium]